MPAPRSGLGLATGAGLGVAGFFQHFALSAALIALPMAVAGVILLRHGVETRGRRLEDIERSLSGDTIG